MMPDVSDILENFKIAAIKTGHRSLGSLAVRGLRRQVVLEANTNLENDCRDIVSKFVKTETGIQNNAQLVLHERLEMRH